MVKAKTFMHTETECEWDWSFFFPFVIWIYSVMCFVCNITLVGRGLNALPYFIDNVSTLYTLDSYKLGNVQYRLDDYVWIRYSCSCP